VSIRGGSYRLDNWEDWPAEERPDDRYESLKWDERLRAELVGLAQAYSLLARRLGGRQLSEACVPVSGIAEVLAITGVGSLSGAEQLEAAAPAPA
jgi:hypothetical protein